MRYKLVEWESKEHGTIKAPNVTILDGPIEDALVVVVDNEMIQRLISLGPGRLQAFVDQTRETIKEAGWGGEIMVCSDDMKFARFEPMEPLTKAQRIMGRDVRPVPPHVPPVQEPPPPEPSPSSETAEVPSLDQVWAEQSRSLQEMRAEVDRDLIRDILEDEAKVCPHCGDPGCAGAMYDPGDCPEA